MDKIKNGFERGKKVLSLKPEIGKSSATSITKSIDGLTCEVTEGKWKFIVDMPTVAGGNAKGPTAGVLGRAALGSCLTIGYLMYASYKEVPVNNISVEIQTDYDDGGLFGTSDSPPGYLEVRYVVNIDSPASKEQITTLLDEAEKHSPYLDVFSRAQSCKRIVKLGKF